MPACSRKLAANFCYLGKCTMTQEELNKIVEKLSADAGIKCPACGAAIGVEVVSKAMENSRVSFSLQPHPGEFLSAGTVGKALAAMEDIFVAVGKELGVKTTLNVEGIECVDGAVKFNLMLARHERPVGKRAPVGD